MTGLAVPQSCGMAGGGKAPAAFFGQLRPDVNLYPGTPQADISPGKNVKYKVSIITDQEQITEIGRAHV